MMPVPSPDRPSQVLDLLVRTYQRLLELGFALLPLLVIAYLQIFQDPAQTLEEHGFHELVIAVATVQGGFIAWVTWRCYLHSGEPFLRWLTVAFVGFTVIYSLHGVFTPMAHDHLALFILYGPASRFVMAACMTAAMLSYGQPPVPLEKRFSRRFWPIWFAVFVAINLLVAYLAQTELGASVFFRLGLESTALLLCLICLAVLLRRPIKSPLMTLFALSLANFAQSSFAFMLASAWNHLWWLAHVIFAIGFLGLSYGVLKAYFTSRSFELVFSQEELFERIREAHAATTSALARAHLINAELEHRNAQLQLARQEFESLFSMAPDGVLVVDAAGKVVKANAKALEFFGYDEAQLLGLTVEDLMPESSRAAHVGHRHAYGLAPTQRMMTSSRTLSARRRDGSCFFTEISLSPLIFNSQPCTMAIVRDVTAARKVDERLRISQQRFRDLFDHGPIGMALVRPDGQWQEVNDALCRLLGYERAELMASRLENITHPEDLNLDQAQKQQLVAGGRAFYQVEKRFLRADGVVIWAVLTGSLLKDGEGRPLNFVAQIEDVTDRRHMEREREEHAENLARLSHRLVAVQEEERRRLAETVHDLVSPNLAAVKINLGILGQQLPSDSGEIQARLEDTRALLEDTTSSIRSLTTELRPIVLDFAGLWPAVDSYAQQFASRTGIEVALEGEPGGRLPADKESLLFRIVQEAMTNCAKHAQARHVRIKLHHDAEHAELIITDDGIGFQPDPNRTPTGLGLLTMRERAEFAGGRFQLSSRPGQGTQVTVTF